MPATFWIGVGGAIGSIARYWCVILAQPLGKSLPFGTILVNIVGSFAIAFFGTLTIDSGRYPLPETARLFFMVGVCGGFTTFSSFSLQTLDLLRDGALGRAILNIGISVLFCLASVAAGYVTAEHLNGGFRQVTENVVEEA